MNDFWKNLAALIKVKTIVTMVVIGVFAAMPTITAANCRRCMPT